MFPPIRQPVTRDDHGRKGETGEMRCCKLKDLHRHPVTCNNPATVVIWVMVKGTVTLVTLCQECLP
uniref:Uncharacterized protein n=1 Tax=viral metagenome TaxID=1070528 RepID=A0A6M3XYX2_9ZZZZ